jgi:hypothetical protein
VNFPLENPIIAFLYWLGNTPGLGGVALAVIVAGCGVLFAAALRWIQRGAAKEESAEYPYPTSALHRH